MPGVRTSHWWSASLRTALRRGAAHRRSPDKSATTIIERLVLRRDAAHRWSPKGSVATILQRTTPRVVDLLLCSVCYSLGRGCASARAFLMHAGCMHTHLAADDLDGPLVAVARFEGLGARDTYWGLLRARDAPDRQT